MIVVVRTIIIYIVVVFSLRLMGKKQIGELEPAELAVAIMISELASIPLATKDVPLLNGIIPVMILAVCEMLVSILILKSVRLRKVIIGSPSILVEKGVLKEDILRKTRFTTDDLLEEMRINGVSNISDIQYAIIETNGQVSFILNKKNSPPTGDDLKLNIQEDDLAFPVINKGIILKENLNIIQRNEEWVMQKMKEKSIKDINDILLMTANHEHIKFFQLKNNKAKGE